MFLQLELSVGVGQAPSGAKAEVMGKDQVAQRG